MIRQLTELFTYSCAFALLFSTTCYGQQNTVRFAGEESQKIGYGSIRYLPSGDSVVEINQAINLYKKDLFQANTLPDLNLGIAKDNYWIQFSVTNATLKKETLFINLENPRLNEISGFLVWRDSVTTTFEIGDFFPFHTRLIHFNQFAFPIVIQALDTLDVFLLIKHKGNTLQVPIQLSNEKGLFNYIENNYMATGMVSGILLITFFFGIFFLFNTKDLLFVYYSGYIGTSLAWVWTTEGFGFQYLYPEHPVLATRLGPGMSIILIVFFIATCLQFCKPYDDTSFLRKVLFIVMFFFLVWGPLPFLPFIPIADPGFMNLYLTVHFFVNIVCIILLMSYLTILALRGNYIVLYYFAAVALNLVFSFVLVARHSGWVNIPFSSGLFMSIGFVVEIILMTAGITKQFYTYRKEKEETFKAYLDQQKSITSKILHTQETERNRISRELHDDIGPKLTQITLMSENLKAQAHEETPLTNSLAKISETSQTLVSSMGEIIWSLNPENKSLHSLLGYLREQLNQLLEYSSLQYKIDFQLGESDRELSQIQLRNVLLITKEIVHNAIKHSKAKSISIKGHVHENHLKVTIIDDGKGIDLSRQAHGSGLKNIRHRIEELGGSLSIHTSVGNGASFSYSIPY